MRKIIAKIYLQNIKNNALAFKKLTGVKLCAVVKADAYGHGAEEVTNALSGVADYFAVALLSEAISIRAAACGKKILILTPPTSQEEILIAAKNGFIITVPNLHTAKLVAKVVWQYQVCVHVHLKGNVGMNRYGTNASWLGRICKCLQGKSGVSVDGFYAHLYTDTVLGARKSREKFVEQRKVVLRYFKNATCHLSATYGTTIGKSFAFDMVRIGIGLYGYYPKGVFRRPIALKKGMQVFAPVISNRKYSFGGAGYGEKTVDMQKGEDMHVLRFGYADGFLRNQKNGTIGCETHINALCMDACIRKGKAKRGEWECILSDAEETANAAQTIVYEVLCAATKRAERRYEYDEISNIFDK